MKIIKEPFMRLEPEHFISVTFETEVKDADSVRELIEKCAKNVLERENIPFDAEIDARVVDAEEIRRLNAEFRDKDVVTDVLSFPMFDYYNGAPREDLEPDPESGRVMLGDMVLCYTRACEQAEEYGHSAARECGFLTTHSVLHLLGYDHERGEDDTARMRRREKEYLEAIGLTRDDGKFRESFLYAGRGLRLCITGERNFRVHMTAAFYVTAAAVMGHVTSTEAAVLCLCFGLTMGAELMNTAVERLCDKTARGYDRMVRDAKDIAAAAVFVCAAACVAVGVCIFLAHGVLAAALRFLAARLWLAMVFLVTVPAAVWFVFFFGRKQ